MSSGRGIVIHRDRCRNLAEYRKQPAKWIPVNWTRGVKAEFESEIQVGRSTASACSPRSPGGSPPPHTNIEHVRVDRDGDASALAFRLKVRDRRQLAQVVRSIRTIPGVVRVSRSAQLIRTRTAWQRNRFTRRDAPAAIGPYSQAIRAGNTVYLSGQIPLNPATMELVKGDIRGADRARCSTTSPRSPKAAGGSLANAVRLTVYLTDLAHFPRRQRDHGGVLQGAVSGARRDRRRAVAARRRRRGRRHPRPVGGRNRCAAAIAVRSAGHSSDGRGPEGRRAPGASSACARSATCCACCRSATRIARALRADRQPRASARRRCVEGVIELSEVAFRRRRSLLCRLADGTGAITLRFFYFNRSHQQSARARPARALLRRGATRPRRASRWCIPSIAPCGRRRRSRATA